MSVLLSFHHASVAELVNSLIDHGINIAAVETGYTTRMNIYCSRNIKLLDTRDYRFPRNILRLNDNNDYVLSDDVVKEFALCERDYLSVADRLSVEPLTVRDRRVLFYELLRYWLWYFKTYPDIDMVFFREAPHTGYDMVMYAVARYYGLEVRYVEQCKLGDFHLVRHRHDEVDKVPKRYFPKLSLDGIQKILHSKHLAVLAERVDSALYSAHKQTKTGRHYQIEHPHFMRLRRFQSNVAKGFRNGLYWLRDRSLSITDYQGGETYAFMFKWLLLRRYSKVKALKKYYNDHTCAPNLKEKYVLFTFHLQPERTSSPFLAGIYEDQVVAVETLSKALPDDWYIYVKEHPLTFYASFWASSDFQLLHSVAQLNYRSIDDYQRLLALPNVKLVPTDFSIGKLLDHAQASATLTGTATWSGLFKGKPGIVFGYPWYVGCNSIYKVDGVSDCVAAIESIQKTSPEQVLSDIYRFLAYNRKRFVYLKDFNSNLDYFTVRACRSKRNAQELAKMIGCSNEALEEKFQRDYHQDMSKLANSRSL